MITLLKSQLDATLGMLEDAIGRFDAQSWKAGWEKNDYPWLLAVHTVESLNGYFSLGAASQPPHFGKRCWDMTPEEAPSVEDVQEFLQEVKTKIEQRMADDESRDLAEAFDPTKQGYMQGFSLLAQYVYAIRHTMHHVGSLAVLADKAGAADLKWR